MNEAAVESFSSHYIKGPCKVLSEDDDASEATEATRKLCLDGARHGAQVAAISDQGGLG
jgi:hypothetical protein